MPPMNMNMYRVLSLQVICSDGLPANLAVFAYARRPGINDIVIHEDDQKHITSGCAAAERQLKLDPSRLKLSGRIVFADRWKNNRIAEDQPVRLFDGVTLNDKMFQRAPVVPGVNVPKPKASKRPVGSVKP